MKLTMIKITCIAAIVISLSSLLLLTCIADGREYKKAVFVANIQG